MKIFHIKRNIARYDGEYLNISKIPVKELKAKSSITMKEAVQLAAKNDSKMLYFLKNAGGVIVDIKKGSEIKYTDTKEKWAIPEGSYYLFDVSGSTASGQKLTDYSYTEWR